MNLNPLNYFRRDVGAKAPLRSDNPRDTKPQGPWTTYFQDWVPRNIAPRFYEALRESIPVIDGAIGRLKTLDGVLRIEADSDAQEREIREWMDAVRVNDMEQSLQAFYMSQGNELYEQGFTIGEYVAAESGRDIERLRVGDSKGFYFRRGEDGGLETWYAPPAHRKPTTRDGREQVEDVLRNNWVTDQNGPVAFLENNGYRRLDPGNLIYAGFNNEADNPYGVSLMRSTEFAAKTLLTLENSLQQVWERFGNPSFNLTYKVASKSVASDPKQLEERRKTLADNLSDAAKKKRQGNAVDMVNAIGKDDDLQLEVIGHDGQVLEIETPARHVLEQIVAKSGLPSWMLGYHWSTAERLAQRQGEMVLQESRTRFELRRPQLEALIATMLRMRGRTWKRGSWWLTQELPNLQDMVAKAQAGFLEAQTQMMLEDAGIGDPGDSSKRFWMDGDGKMSFDLHRPREKAARPPRIDTAPHEHGHQHGKEPFAEDGEYLGKLERRAAGAMLRGWNRLRADTLDALGLGEHKDETPFVFSAVSMLPMLRELQEQFEAEIGGEDARLTASIAAAYERGLVENAGAELGIEEPSELVNNALQEAGDAIRRNALSQVQNTTARAYQDDVIQILEQGTLNGQNPKDVARELSNRFGVHTNDWTRLAASEITGAHADGKLKRYEMEGETGYDWITAADASVCPICDGYEAGNPHTVGVGPRPSRDSHPYCRCTVAAR